VTRRVKAKGFADLTQGSLSLKLYFLESEETESGLRLSGLSVGKGNGKPLPRFVDNLTFAFARGTKLRALNVASL
jgi:hypothetical protein